MKITRDESYEYIRTEVLIKSPPGDREALWAEETLKSRLKSLPAKKDGASYNIPAGDILYLESMERSVYIYTPEDVFHGISGLSEYEEALKDHDFIRISKSTLLNTGQLKSVRAQLNGRYEATMNNGEKLVINRRYVPDLKAKFGL